jgi:hypothetical protein
MEITNLEIDQETLAENMNKTKKNKVVRTPKVPKAQKEPKEPKEPKVQKEAKTKKIKSPKAPKIKAPKLVKEPKIKAPKPAKKQILNIIPDIETIILFKVSSNTRADNDKSNKIREDIIAQMTEIVKFEEYFSDTTYGEQWTNLRNKLQTCIRQIYYVDIQDKPFEYYKIKKMAGRVFNYDFNVLYYDENSSVIREVHLEFKHGTSSLDKMPQFLSLNIRFDMCPVSYEEYYYDNFINLYVTADSGINIEIPEKTKYLKHVTNVNYEVDPFFKQLYDREEIEKQVKAKIVNDSIRTYLERYGHLINFVKLTNKFQDSQQNKIFMMWDGNNFNTDRLDGEDLIVHTFVGIKHHNSIIVRSDTYEYSLLLRWRNHKGILNPAWQISLKKI